MRPSTVTHVKIGNRSKTLFWNLKDRWTFGRTACEIAPLVWVKVATRRISCRTVAVGLPDNPWVRDIEGALSPLGLVQYIKLRDAMAGVDLDVHQDDQFTWMWNQS